MGTVTYPPRIGPEGECRAEEQGRQQCREQGMTHSSLIGGGAARRPDRGPPPLRRAAPQLPQWPRPRPSSLYRLRHKTALPRSDGTLTYAHLGRNQAEVNGRLAGPGGAATFKSRPTLALSVFPEYRRFSDGAEASETEPGWATHPPWRRQDLNLRPLGYGPSVLPSCTTPLCMRASLPARMSTLTVFAVLG